MWLWRIPILTLSFTGSFVLMKLPEPTGVQFDSVNFNNTLRWTQKGSQEIVYDVEYLIYGEKIWKNKLECHHIAANYCDLTNEIVQENNWYYARVMAILKNVSSTWSLSERFCPLDKTIIGAPAVEHTAGVRSITILVHLPQVPPKKGVQRSIEDIFDVIEYEVQLSQSLTNKMVYHALNKSGYFKIESLEPNTKYCANVQLSFRKEIFSKKSQPAHFCIQTSQERTLTIVLLMAFVFSGAIIIGIFSLVAYSYIKQRRTLPQSLNLDLILSHKKSLLKQSSPTLQLVTNYKKNAFQFEQVIRMDDIDLLKCDSNEKEEIMKTKELTLITQLNSYAPQCHTRILQTNLPSAIDCEIQSNSSSNPTDNRCSSPYCPQATNRVSNSTCSSQNSSQALSQNYATILNMISQNSTKLNTDARLFSTQKVPLNALQTMNVDLLYNNGELMLQNDLVLEMLELKFKEGKPTQLPPFLSLLNDKQQTYQTKWKENQPIEMPLLLSLKDENQIDLSLLQYGQQMDNQSFLSLLKDKVDVSCLQPERMNDQPIKLSLTEVLQTDLKGSQAGKVRPLLKDDKLTELPLVKTGWEDGYKGQLLTFHSSMREGQHTDASFLQTLQTNIETEGCKLLEDWEIEVHMDE